MISEERLLYARGLFSICVDSRPEGDLSGRLYHCFSSEALPFSGAQQLVLKMDAVFFEVGFPQSATQTRSFSKNKASHSPEILPIIGKKEEILMEPEQISAQKGGKATFVVRVQFRQNATWQGSLVWGEKGRTVQFRSALELLKLIDSALQEEAGTQDVVLEAASEEALI